MMSTFTDTDPEAERVHLELLRRAPLARRAALALSLSRTVIGLARRALQRAHPDETDVEISLRLVERSYGSELAAAVRRRLATR